MVHTLCPVPQLNRSNGRMPGRNGRIRRSGRAPKRELFPFVQESGAPDRSAGRFRPSRAVGAGGTLRLARRLRLAAMALAMAVGFLFGTMAEAFELPASAGQAVKEVQAPPSPAVVVVRPGDTLWSIALAYAPEGADVRKYVHALRKANGLEKSLVHAGQTLVLP